jgi:hypothetical protein
MAPRWMTCAQGLIAKKMCILFWPFVMNIRWKESLDPEVLWIDAVYDVLRSFKVIRLMLTSKWFIISCLLGPSVLYLNFNIGGKDNAYKIGDVLMAMISHYGWRWKETETWLHYQDQMILPYLILLRWLSDLQIRYLDEKLSAVHILCMHFLCHYCHRAWLVSTVNTLVRYSVGIGVPDTSLFGLWQGGGLYRHSQMSSNLSFPQSAPSIVSNEKKIFQTCQNKDGKIKENRGS